MTSPPYWGLRDYEDAGAVSVPGQHGREGTVGGYVGALVEATAEWLRVLKPGGSMWVLLGDRYTGRHPRTLALAPQRYVIACADALGLTVRAEVVWSKPSALPERATDRVARTHETLWHLVRGSEPVWADLDPLRAPRVTSSRTRGHKARMVPGQVAHRWLSDGNPAGRAPGSVWTVPSEPLRLPEGLADSPHPAPLPTEIARRVITGWCPPGGLVLDPYGGSGTVAHVAAALGRTGVTSDLSSRYAMLAADERVQARRARKVLTGSPALQVLDVVGQQALFPVA